MGELIDRWDLPDAGMESVPIEYLTDFMMSNFNLSPADIKQLDNKHIPIENPEMVLKLITRPPTPLSPKGFFMLGLEYDGVLYDETIPIHIFNYFSFWVSKFEDVKYKTVEDLRRRYEKVYQDMKKKTEVKTEGSE